MNETKRSFAGSEYDDAIGGDCGVDGENWMLGRRSEKRGVRWWEGSEGKARKKREMYLGNEGFSSCEGCGDTVIANV